MPDLTGTVYLSIPCANPFINSHVDRSCDGREHWHRIRDRQAAAFEERVYLGARSPDKAAATIKRLEGETGRTAIFLQLDLADLPVVRKTAETFLTLESRLDLLFNNAGVMNVPPEMLTAQNYDLQFGTNVIGHFFLTQLLLPALTQSYKKTNVPARIINTSSIGHQMAPGNGMEAKSIKGGPAHDAWLKKTGGFMGTWRLYAQSKMGILFISNYFAKKHSDVLVSCAVHSNGVRTELGRHSPLWQRIIYKAFLYPAPMGAYKQLWGATIAMPSQITGQYLIPWGKVGTADKRVSSAQMEDEVIAYIREQIKGF
ncbi:hypothetical protein C8R44DRAFT_868920 [Mycena epipterygia]|nr:hypothetical protein C8R44DRAFT_868920 [Mycena epipterygia]